MLQKPAFADSLIQMIDFINAELGITSGCVFPGLLDVPRSDKCVSRTGLRDCPGDG